MNEFRKKYTLKALIFDTILGIGFSALVTALTINILSILGVISDQSIHWYLDGVGILCLLIAEFWVKKWGKPRL